MDAANTSTSAYRNRKRPLDGRPCNPKVKRRLFPADVPCPNRLAAAVEMKPWFLKRKLRWRAIYKASYMIQAAADELRLLAEMGSYSRPELHPLGEAMNALLPAMRACDEAAEATLEVPPDLCDDDSTSSSPPPSSVESGGSGAAFVAATPGGDTVSGKRHAKANSRYYGPEWSKK